MNGDTAAALRQIRLALQRLLGPRLEAGPQEAQREKRAKAAMAANGNANAKATSSGAKASGG